MNLVRNLYIQFMLVACSTIYVPIDSYACSMPEEPYYMVHPSFVNLNKYGDSGYNTIKEFLNIQIEKKWVKNPKIISIVTNQIVEDPRNVPVTILLDKSHIFSSIEILMILDREESGKYYPYPVAEFELNSQRLTEITFRMKMYEGHGRLLAIGYKKEKKAVISNEKIIKNTGYGCVGPLYVPTLGLAKKLNRKVCDYYHQGNGKYLDWSHLPACKPYEEL